MKWKPFQFHFKAYHGTNAVLWTAGCWFLTDITKTAIDSPRRRVSYEGFDVSDVDFIGLRPNALTENSRPTSEAIHVTRQSLAYPNVLRLHRRLQDHGNKSVTVKTNHRHKSVDPCTQLVLYVNCSCRISSENGTIQETGLPINAASLILSCSLLQEKRKTWSQIWVGCTFSLSIICGSQALSNQQQHGFLSSGPQIATSVN